MIALAASVVCYFFFLIFEAFLVFILEVFSGFEFDRVGAYDLQIGAAFVAAQ